MIHFTLLINLLFSCNLLGLGVGVKNCTSFLVACVFWVESCLWLNVKLQSQCPKDQEQVTHAYAVQHPEKLCRTVRNSNVFLAHPTDWDKSSTSQKNTRHHLRLILSPQGRQQSLSLGITHVCSAVLCSLHDNTGDSHSCDECRKSAFLIHFVTHLASVFTDHKMSRRPMPATCKHFKTICEQTSDNSPSDSRSSCLKCLSSKQGCETLQSCFLFFCLPMRSIAQRIFEHVLPCRRTPLLFLREVSAILVIFCCSSRKT